MTPPIRILPHNLSAEASVLGGVLLRRAALDEPAVAALEVPDFYGPKHQAVWMAMRNLEATSQPIDPITVEVELARLGKLDAVGGLAALGELMLAPPSVERAGDYARIVARLAVRRRVIVALGEAQDRLYAADEDDEDLNGEAARSFAAAAIAQVQCKSETGARTIGQVVKARVAQIDRVLEARQRGEVAITGVPTGIATLDRRLGGYQPGIMTIVAARPGMGKSSVMMAGADAASAAGFGVHVFAFEDAEESLADRAMARLSGVPATSIRAGDLQRGEMGKIGAALNTLSARARWRLEDRPSPYVDDIVRAVRRDLAAHGTKLVIVDYLQLLRGPRSRKYRAADREQEISDIGTEFMLASRDDGIAYLVGSQLNRECERREDKRPMVSDLRGSGTIEERAKCIVMLYRGVEYGPAVEGRDERTRADGSTYLPLDDEWATQLELLVEKNSNGEKGRLFATFDGPTMRVS
jgi:replicative DNA helicase